MSDQIFLFSDQNGALVGQMSFQGKIITCSPDLCSGLPLALFIHQRKKKNHKIDQPDGKNPPITGLLKRLVLLPNVFLS